MVKKVCNFDCLGPGVSRPTGYRSSCRYTDTGGISCNNNDQQDSGTFCIATVEITAECTSLRGCFDDSLANPVDLSSCSAQTSPTATPSSSNVVSITSSRFSSVTSGTTPTSTPSTSQTIVQSSGTSIAAATGSLNSNNTSDSGKSDGISSPAAAGIAVGAAIGGALLASLVFIILFLRWKKRQHQTIQYNEAALSAYGGHGSANEKKSERYEQKALNGVDSYLPQPAEDEAIISELSKLRDKIKNHAQGFYVGAPVDPVAIDQRRLAELSSVTGFSTAQLHDRLLNPQTRVPTLRLCLAWIILSRCGTEQTSECSFLPQEVAQLAVIIPTKGTNNIGKNLLAIKWKAISADLLQDNASQKNETELEQNMAQCMKAVDSLLAAFIDPASDGASDKRHRNLESILRKAAHFAFFLFAQPSVFKLDWAAPRGAIVVFPGLRQLINEDGNVTQRIFCEPEVAGL